MCADDVGGVSSCDSGTADDEWDMNVFFESAFFAGVKALLRNVVAVVSGVDDMCVVEDAVLL